MNKIKHLASIIPAPRRKQMPPQFLKSESGLALISVMLVISLCVIIAAELTKKQSYQIKRAESLFTHQQAFWYAMSAEHFVKSLLQDTSKEDDGRFHLSQAWAMEGMSFPLDKGMIEGEITDLNACFNLNSLYQEGLTNEQQQFRKEVLGRLFANLGVQSELSHRDLVNNIYDWLDPDDYPIESIGSDGDSYAALDFPYLSANSTMIDSNELRVIAGFDLAVLSQLNQSLCVIPNHRSFLINVNNIKPEQPELLMALFDIDRAQAEEALNERPENGFEKIDEFWQLKAIKGSKNFSKIEKSQFTLSSKFFRLVTHAYYNELKFSLTSIIQLNNAQQALVIARRFGGKIERKTDPKTQ